MKKLKKLDHSVDEFLRFLGKEELIDGRWSHTLTKDIFISDNYELDMRFYCLIEKKSATCRLYMWSKVYRRYGLSDNDEIEISLDHGLSYSSETDVRFIWSGILLK